MIPIHASKLPKSWLKGWDFVDEWIDGVAWVRYEVLFPLGSTLDW